MIKKFDIWNSEINLEDWKDFLEEDRDLNPDLYEGGEDGYLRVCEVNFEYLEDERINLDKKLENPILIIADLGLWNGRATACKILESGNLKDILYAQVNGISENHWYCDGYNICCDEIHHDGINHYLYREIRNMANIERFLELIYKKQDWKSCLNYYTRSIAKEVGRMYGLCK